ncbi:hypothetical protein DPMN_190991 [Dreissena polymorpha]|uniref:Uncharacterized protein n=1 Tax=Dreissena polymorpha TaxID=45954 RepID=A0A9D4BED6_DREPO|nr:hypothetical protein DPMN_190991 [Dreissena polymorpha]
MRKVISQIWRSVVKKKYWNLILTVDCSERRLLSSLKEIWIWMKDSKLMKMLRPGPVT